MITKKENMGRETESGRSLACVYPSIYCSYDQLWATALGIGPGMTT